MTQPYELLIAALSLLAFPVLAEEAKQATSPKEACEKIVEAGKKGDFNLVKQYTAGGMEHHQKDGQTDKKMENMSEKSKKDFEQMRQAHMDELKDLKCSSEQTVENHAFVTAETKDGKRLIPFVKEGEGWKFDPRTYMSFYRKSMKEHGIGMHHKMEKGKGHSKGDKG
jgi:hypothetical protein